MGSGWGCGCSPLVAGNYHIGCCCRSYVGEMLKADVNACIFLDSGPEDSLEPQQAGRDFFRAGAAT